MSSSSDEECDEPLFPKPGPGAMKSDLTLLCKSTADQKNRVAEIGLLKRERQIGIAKHITDSIMSKEFRSMERRMQGLQRRREESRQRQDEQLKEVTDKLERDDKIKAANPRRNSRREIPSDSKAYPHYIVADDKNKVEVVHDSPESISSVRRCTRAQSLDLHSQNRLIKELTNLDVLAEKHRREEQANEMKMRHLEIQIGMALPPPKVRRATLHDVPSARKSKLPGEATRDGRPVTQGDTDGAFSRPITTSGSVRSNSSRWGARSIPNLYRTSPRAMAKFYSFSTNNTPRRKTRPNPGPGRMFPIIPPYNNRSPRSGNIRHVQFDPPGRPNGSRSCVSPRRLSRQGSPLRSVSRSVSQAKLVEDRAMTPLLNHLRKYQIELMNQDLQLRIKAFLSSFDEPEIEVLENPDSDDEEVKHRGSKRFSYQTLPTLPTNKYVVEAARNNENTFTLTKTPEIIRGRQLLDTNRVDTLGMWTGIQSPSDLRVILDEYERRVLEGSDTETTVSSEFESDEADDETDDLTTVFRKRRRHSAKYGKEKIMEERRKLTGLMKKKFKQVAKAALAVRKFKFTLPGAIVPSAKVK